MNYFDTLKLYNLLGIHVRISLKDDLILISILRIHFIFAPYTSQFQATKTRASYHLTNSSRQHLFP